MCGTSSGTASLPGRHSAWWKILCCILLAITVSSLSPVFAASEGENSSAPFALKAGLFDQSEEQTLGLDFAPGRQTFTVFAPVAHQNAYNHGAVVTAFKGRILVQWQSSRRDEDAPETSVQYAWAAWKDLQVWSEPAVLAQPRPGQTITNGGWWQHGDSLVAFLNVWSRNAAGQRTGRTEFIKSTDGVSWTVPQPVLGVDEKPVLGVIEQDPMRLTSGRIVTAFHIEPGIQAHPFYTDDPSGVSGWQKATFESLGQKDGVSRELEPSSYAAADGRLVMVFRDQFSSFRTLASESFDRGESWSKPTLIDFPDSRSKQSAGNLPNGMVYRVNNPRLDRTRYPLVLTLSKGGKVFDRAYLIRAGGVDMQPQRFEGKYKRAGFSYPKSAVIDDYLYVAYATNKEDIEITRIPWRRLLSIEP